MDSAVPVLLFFGEIYSPIRGDALGEVCIELATLFLFEIFKGLSLLRLGELAIIPDVSRVGWFVPGSFVLRFTVDFNLILEFRVSYP